MSEASVMVKIPRERVGVLIGPDGEVKRLIERKLSVKLHINSDSGDVTISLMPNAEDPSRLFRAKEVVIAIGRGFSPARAFRLLESDDVVLDIIDLREIVGKSEADMKRLKGRIIGKDGKTRRKIEELTDTSISVYGHTIGIIGNMEQAQVTRDAIQMFLRGSQHRTVYRFLHRKRREFKKRKLELWEEPHKELKV